MTEFRMFLDESGDHNLYQIDKNFPVFCLVGCIFEKFYYHDIVRRELDNLKMRFWGNTEVILHSREIRKREGNFVFLGNDKHRTEFYECINQLIGSLNFYILAVVIFKHDHRNKYAYPIHPYHLSLEFIMERFCIFMNRGIDDCSGYMMAESRGLTEDTLLKSVYEKLHDGGSKYVKNMHNICGLRFEKKEKNIAGLQIADLIAYPIATRILHPTRSNMAFEVIKPKIICADKGKGASILGYGIKIFPNLKQSDLNI